MFGDSRLSRCSREVVKYKLFTLASFKKNWEVSCEQIIFLIANLKIEIGYKFNIERMWSKNLSLSLSLSKIYPFEIAIYDIKKQYFCNLCFPLKKFI